jgi:HK97 family phage major capsid protein
MDDKTPETPPASGGDQYRALIDEMGKLYERMRGLVDKANRVGEMSEEEEEEMARMQKKYDQLRALKARNEQMLRIASETRTEAPTMPFVMPSAQRSTQAPTITSSPEYRDAFTSYLKGPRFMGDAEQRALSEGVAADGGFLPSTDFYGSLVKVLEQQVIYRRIANVMSLGAFKTNIALESTIASATWGAEAAAIDETTPQFAELIMQPRRLSAIVKSSIELIEDAPSRGAGFSVESIVSDQLGRAFALAEEQAFSVGTSGANQPRGIFTYTAAGQIADGKTAASATAVTANELLDFVYSLPRQYREQKSTCIVTSDAMLALIRKLASPGTNTFLSYLWQPSFQQGEPDRLSGIPIYATQYAPAIAASARVAVIGDFSRYHIGIRSNMSVKVLRELYAGNGQIGFQGIARLDAGCSIFNAFRYLRMGA